MTHNLVICWFSEQRYMILNLCTFFWDTRYTIHLLKIKDILCWPVSSVTKVSYLLLYLEWQRTSWFKESTQLVARHSETKTENLVRNLKFQFGPRLFQWKLKSIFAGNFGVSISSFLFSFPGFRENSYPVLQTSIQSFEVMARMNRFDCNRSPVPAMVLKSNILGLWRHIIGTFRRLRWLCRKHSNIVARHDKTPFKSTLLLRDKILCRATRVSCRVGVTLCCDFYTLRSCNTCIFSLTTCAGLRYIIKHLFYETAWSILFWKQIYTILKP